MVVVNDRGKGVSTLEEGSMILGASRAAHDFSGAAYDVSAVDFNFICAYMRLSSMFFEIILYYCVFVVLGSYLGAYAVLYHFDSIIEIM